MKLPPVSDNLFPRPTTTAVAWFWLWYWVCFFAFLPWMLLRQAGLMLCNTVMTACTWNRVVQLDDKLRLVYLNGATAFPASLVWGERFTAVHYGDVLIDPGPVTLRRAMRRYADKCAPGEIAAIVVTHWHEEHIGNAVTLARRLGVPIYGSRMTLAALGRPMELSLPRRMLMGRPAFGRDVELRELGELGDRLVTPRCDLRVIESPGHCRGHLSLFDEARGLLLAGDSFMHTIFTSPNADVRADDWLDTLHRYAALDIATLVTGHGWVYTRDAQLRGAPFVTLRADPNVMVRDKLAFMRWSQRVVAAGEAIGHRYSVIEASLFPWSRAWTRRTWFRDEASRLFSAGEFSRTHFVRSLAARPHRIGPRFPRMARLTERLQHRLCPRAA